MDDADLQRWRGKVDAYMEQSVLDRAALHTLVDKIIERGDRRHEELLEELRKAVHAQRDALQVVANAIAIQKSRIDAWENRAEGATWAARLIPHGITAALTSAAWWLLTGGRAGGPPGGN